MKRALLVIDVQNEYVTGSLPIAYPPVGSSLAAIGTAMDAATDHEIPVIVIRQDAPAGSPIFARGSDGWQLHESVRSRPSTVTMSKTLPSAFAGTDLAPTLASLGVDTIAIVGYMTQNCDESTARDAAHRGYAVEFLHDATGAPHLTNAAGTVDARTLHETVLTVLESRFAAVVTTDQWIDALRSGTPLTGSTIAASVAAAI